MLNEQFEEFKIKFKKYIKRALSVLAVKQLDPLNKERSQLSKHIGVLRSALDISGPIFHAQGNNLENRLIDQYILQLYSGEIKNITAETTKLHEDVHKLNNRRGEYTYNLEELTLRFFNLRNQIIMFLRNL